MKFFPFSIPSFKPSSGNKFSALNREDIIFVMVMALVVVLLALIFWSGYLFYESILVYEEPAVQRPGSLFSSKEIDVVMLLLDDRQKKLTEILGGGVSAEVTKTEN